MESLKQKGSRVLESAFTYAELRMRLLALKSADKGSRLASNFLTILILLVILIFSAMLINIGLALLISRALDTTAAGFFIMGAVNIILGVVLFVMRKKIIFEPLLNAIVSALVGAELRAEEKLERVQDRIEDRLNLPEQVY